MSARQKRREPLAGGSRRVAQTINYPLHDDIYRQRTNQDYAETVGMKKLMLAVPFRKLNRDEFYSRMSIAPA